MVAHKVNYWGRVQGVGFRYTAQSLAQGLPIAGYVKNLPDGQVELWVEGEAGAVERFLQALDDQLGSYIKGKQVRDETPSGLTGFSIR